MTPEERKRYRTEYKRLWGVAYRKKKREEKEKLLAAEKKQRREFWTTILPKRRIEYDHCSCGRVKHRDRFHCLICQSPMNGVPTADAAEMQKTIIREVRR